jgi:peptidoglycan/LPS O-acetylase OafA/YrhL
MKYDPALDGMRAVAVAAVIVYHLWPDALPGGWVGVNIFFVLSGYLITTILQAELARDGRINLFRFYARRVLRLTPALWLLLVASLVAAVVVPNHKWFTSVAISGIYMMNWARALELTGGGLLGHTWSLAMEEQFYFVWPLVMLLFKGKRLAVFTTVALVGIVAWRCYLALNGAGVMRVYNGFDTHTDTLLIGCLLALASARFARGNFAAWSIPAVLILGGFMAAAAYGGMFQQTLGVSLAGLGTVFLIISARSEGLPRRLFSLAPLVFLGRISYGLYLWHYPIHYVGALYGINQLVVIPLTIIAALLSYYLVEVRFLALKGSTDSLASLLNALGVRRSLPAVQPTEA